jgi:biotin carboxyl carrier protein
MPGLVLKLFVKEGDEIKEGDSHLILEAMKMENVIKSPGNGKVKLIRVTERSAVEKNQELIEVS